MNFVLPGYLAALCLTGCLAAESGEDHDPLDINEDILILSTELDGKMEGVKDEICLDDPELCAGIDVDDSFAVDTINHCGTAIFVDYGPGGAGGGNNDDYVLIHDNCGDAHGVKAFIVHRKTDGDSVRYEAYNGNGFNGPPIIFDPFKVANDTDVDAGDTVEIRACLVDGANDTTPFNCSVLARQSTDG